MTACIIDRIKSENQRVADLISEGLLKATIATVNARNESTQLDVTVSLSNFMDVLDDGRGRAAMEEGVVSAIVDGLSKHAEPESGDCKIA